MTINKCNNYKKEKALNYPERILSEFDKNENKTSLKVVQRG